MKPRRDANRRLFLALCGIVLLLIVGGTVLLLRHGADGLLAFLGAYGFLALFAIILLEEMGLPLPVPSDIVAIVASSQLPRSPGTAVTFIATITLAATCGASTLYSVCRWGGAAVRPKLERWLRVRPDRIARTQRWFRRRGVVGILLGRLIPGLGTTTTIVAGLAAVPFAVFVPTAAVAAVIWSAGYYFLGDALQQAWPSVRTWFAGDLRRLSILVIVLANLAGIGVWQRRRQGKSGSAVTPERSPSVADESRD